MVKTKCGIEIEGIILSENIISQQIDLEEKR